jgi:hypothetical protein
MVRRASAAAWLLLLSTGAATAQASDTLRALLIEYRCPVVDRLVQIYEFPSPKDYRDRFIAVTLGGHPHGYVQCMFIQNRMRILCEAASGYYYNKDGAPRTFFLSHAAVAALGRLGFSTDDSQGNFRYENDIGEAPDFNALADFILKALHDGYGARAVSTLSFNAPFAQRATTVCRPVS